MALSLGVETSTITRAERGERRLSTELLEHIAAALKVGVTDLYAIVEGREVVPASGKDEESAEIGKALVVLRRLLLDLNPDQRTLIVELAKTVARHPQG